MTRTDTAAGLERFSLSGRISLITGATRGLGLEIARGIGTRSGAARLHQLDGGTAVVPGRSGVRRVERWARELTVDAGLSVAL